MAWSRVVVRLEMRRFSSESSLELDLEDFCEVRNSEVLISFSLSTLEKEVLMERRLEDLS